MPQCNGEDRQWLTGTNMRRECGKGRSNNLNDNKHNLTTESTDPGVKHSGHPLSVLGGAEVILLPNHPNTTLEKTIAHYISYGILG